MFANRKVLGHLALGLLLFGAQACEQSKTGSGGSTAPAGEEGFEQTSFALISAGCVITGTTVAFTLGANESLYMFKRAADGQVVANANLSTNPSAECAFPTTYKITVANTPSTDTHKVLFDFIGGTFGMATAAAAPNLVVTLTGLQNTVKIRGTANFETYTFGTLSTTSYGSFNIGTALALPATPRTFPDLSMTGVQSLVVATSSGNDVITGQGGTPIGGTVGSPGPLDGTIGFDVYGGDGNDTITSGAASATGVSNHLYGNAGDDMFIQQAAKARDIISGSDGLTPVDNDTVDYSGRSNPLSVTLGDDALIGVTSMGVITCASKANTADHQLFSINDGTSSVTYEYQVTPIVPSTGSITTAAQSNYADHDSFTLDDGVHPAQAFEYAQSAAATTLTHTITGATWVDISAATTADSVAAATYAAIHSKTGASFTIVATDPAGTTNVIALTNAAGYNTTIASVSMNMGTAGTYANMASGVRFMKTTSTNVVIDVSAGTVSTDADVCMATGYAITPGGPSGVSATISTNTVLVAITPMAFKPTGAAITKITTAAMFTITDFSPGTPRGQNDGESGEQDSLDNSVENIIGGSGADTLDASLATLVSHVLVGMNGADMLIGSDKADTLWGGLGDDTLKGGKGIDIMNGGDGNDIMQGGPGSDTMDGGGLNCATVPATAPQTTSCTTAAAAKGASTVNPGINTLDYSDRGSAAPVTVDLTNLGAGGATPPTGEVGEKDVVAYVTGSSGPFSVQYLRGGAGNDTLTGDGLANIIWGGDGNDTINGNGANDALYGENGDDVIHGDSATTLPAGQTAGDDFISGGPGMNTLSGDAGNDLIDNTAGTAMGIIDCGIGDADEVMTSAFSDSTAMCELN